ncbi:unnamed protein product [Phytophthora fragariaefolia]|uniref:Unnamed protein product n=1 Tax=Phytophthora fragariaefolia TaxID=1490495 RepID=A0A9W6Y8N3_9STRA|nr:unnamed protein product [Phytophthora fragariaefolia]
MRSLDASSSTPPDRSPVGYSVAGLHIRSTSTLVQHALVDTFGWATCSVATIHTEAVGERAASKQLEIPRRTLRDWMDNKQRIIEFKGAQTSKTTKGQGAKGILLFAHDLVTFMKDVRREEEYLTTGLMISFMKRHQSRWQKAYLDEKDNLEKDLSALMRLCQRLHRGNVEFCMFYFESELTFVISKVWFLCSEATAYKEE